MTSASHDLATVDLDGAVVGEVLRASDKSLLALGHRNGLPVVIKALRTDEEFWQAKFAHEIRLYQAFTDIPPPVRIPRLVHSDGQRVLVIEHIPGHVVDVERYPTNRCPRPRWTQCWPPSPHSRGGAHRQVCWRQCLTIPTGSSATTAPGSSMNATIPPSTPSLMT
jgi:hypothetical protein